MIRPASLVKRIEEMVKASTYEIGVAVEFALALRALAFRSLPSILGINCVCTLLLVSWRMKDSNLDWGMRVSMRGSKSTGFRESMAFLGLLENWINSSLDIFLF